MYNHNRTHNAAPLGVRTVSQSRDLRYSQKRRKLCNHRYNKLRNTRYEDCAKLFRRQAARHNHCGFVKMLILDQPLTTRPPFPPLEAQECMVFLMLCDLKNLSRPTNKREIPDFSSGHDREIHTLVFSFSCLIKTRRHVSLYQ